MCHPQLMKITSISLLPLDGGRLRRELSRTIEVGVDMVCSPSPPPFPPPAKELVRRASAR
jgi:hypothetical protein